MTLLFLNMNVPRLLMSLAYNERLPGAKRSGIFLLLTGMVIGVADVLHSRRENSESGFVLVDTLVAVIVISLILTVCLETVRIAGASSRNTRSATEARALLLGLMETTPRIPGIYRGIGGTMRYTVSVTESELNNVRICRLNASATSKAGHRTYNLMGTRWCAPVRS